jgi:hypothetical protein
MAALHTQDRSQRHTGPPVPGAATRLALAWPAEPLRLLAPCTSLSGWSRLSSASSSPGGARSEGIDLGARVEVKEEDVGRRGSAAAPRLGVHERGARDVGTGHRVMRCLERGRRSPHAKSPGPTGTH